VRRVIEETVAEYGRRKAHSQERLSGPHQPIISKQRTRDLGESARVRVAGEKWEFKQQSSAVDPPRLLIPLSVLLSPRLEPFKAGGCRFTEQAVLMRLCTVDGRKGTGAKRAGGYREREIDRI